MINKIEEMIYSKYLLKNSICDYVTSSTSAHLQ